MFARTRDTEFYLSMLAEWKSKLECKIYAFCLMTNHAHLVIDPGTRAENLGLLMKRLAGRYTRYLNTKSGRSGTCWNGRYKSSPIDSDSYLLACCRYVELNPVRASMVASPEEYGWSSYGDKTGRARFGWLDEDPCFRALGDTRLERQVRYRQWVRAAIPKGEWEFIRVAVQRGQLTGGKAFRSSVEQLTGRRVETRAPGGQPSIGRDPS